MRVNNAEEIPKPLAKTPAIFPLCFGSKFLFKIRGNIVFEYLMFTSIVPM